VRRNDALTALEALSLKPAGTSCRLTGTPDASRYQPRCHRAAATAGVLCWRVSRSPVHGRGVRGDGLPGARAVHARPTRSAHVKRCSPVSPTVHRHALPLVGVEPGSVPDVLEVQDDSGRRDHGVAPRELPIFGVQSILRACSRRKARTARQFPGRHGEVPSRGLRPAPAIVRAGARASECGGGGVVDTTVRSCRGRRSRRGRGVTPSGQIRTPGDSRRSARSSQNAYEGRDRS